MKGIVFTEFLEMVEDKFSPEVVDHILDVADLPSGGVYTAVGVYDHREMASLVTELAKHSEGKVSELLRAFGFHLFSRFFAGYPVFFENIDSSFDFLEGIEDRIHSEVRKLYPDAELPSFEIETREQDELVMLYTSIRCLGDFCQGLIEGCIDHYKEDVSIIREPVGEDNGSQIRFRLERLAA